MKYKMYWNLSTKFCSHFVLLIWFFTGFERGYQETNMQQEYLSFVVPYLIDLDIDSNLDYNYISNYLWLLPIMVVPRDQRVARIWWRPVDIWRLLLEAWEVGVSFENWKFLTRIGFQLPPSHGSANARFLFPKTLQDAERLPVDP